MSRDTLVSIIAIAVVLIVILGPIFYFSHQRDKLWERRRRACDPGIIFTTQMNRVLCTDGKKQWLVEVE